MSRRTNSEPPHTGTSDEASLQSALTRLVDAALLFVEGTPPEASYSFKHALIQDAAYESLLRSAVVRRCTNTLHRRAEVAAQSGAGGDRSSFPPPPVAERPAIEWWGNAEEDTCCAVRQAFEEAMAHLEKSDRARR